MRQVGYLQRVIICFVYVEGRKISLKKKTPQRVIAVRVDNRCFTLVILRITRPNVGVSKMQSYASCTSNNHCALKGFALLWQRSGYA